MLLFFERPDWLIKVPLRMYPLVLLNLWKNLIGSATGTWASRPDHCMLITVTTATHLVVTPCMHCEIVGGCHTCTYIHAHTHIYIYIYRSIDVYVCVCVYKHSISTWKTNIWLVGGHKYIHRENVMKIPSSGLSSLSSSYIHLFKISIESVCVLTSNY